MFIEVKPICKVKTIRGNGGIHRVQILKHSKHKNGILRRYGIKLDNDKRQNRIAYFQRHEFEAKDGADWLRVLITMISYT